MALRPVTVIVVTGLTLAVTLVAFTACRGGSAAAVSPAERGRYIVATSGCHDCHTPWIVGEKGPQPDMSRALCGHPAALVIHEAPAPPASPWLMVGAATNTAWAGPWGVSFTTNLTPDEETGIGAWSEEMFIGAMRTGRHLGAGRPILPPMPWPGIGSMTDDDLKAVFAFLKSGAPIRNKVPDPLPPAPPPAPSAG